MTRPACARIFQCQNSYRQALAVQEIVMLYLEAEMDKFFFYMNEHQPSHAQFLAILIPTQSAHPIPLCLHLKEPSHRIGQIYSNWKQAGGGGVEIPKMLYAHHPKATAMCDPSWQETWKLPVLGLPLPSQHEVCL